MSYDADAPTDPRTGGKLDYEQCGERIRELETALRGIISHWYEFSGMMGIQDDYGFGNRIEAAEALLAKLQTR